MVLHVCLGSSISGFGHTHCAKSLTTFWSFCPEVTMSRLRMCGCAHVCITYLSPCCDRITEKKPLEGGRACFCCSCAGVQPSVTDPQSGRKAPCYGFSAHSAFFTQSGTPDHGWFHPHLRWMLPDSVNPVQKLPHRCGLLYKGLLVHFSIAGQLRPEVII